jgi:hypothetical protein
MARLGKKCPLLAQSGHARVALHMSAFGGKADMAIALQNVAFDPKRTSGLISI